MNKDKIKKITTISIFGALIIILQLVSSLIKFGGFSITLTLVPIIVVGAVYGVGMGTLMGLVFGAIVNILVITGVEASGTTMLAVHPIITITTVFLKGGLAGLVSAYLFKIFNNKRPKLAIILSAISAPIVNTCTLFIALILFFESSFAIMISYLMSINFVIELTINLLLAPSLLALINRGKNRY